MPYKSIRHRVRLDVINCEILTDSESFYPRQVVSGQVVLSLSTPKQINHLYLEITGNAECQWIAKKCILNRLKIVPRNTMFLGYQDIFYYKETVFGEPNESTDLTEGKHRHYFQCKLPSYIPGTWSGKHGSIRYFIIVTIVSPSAPTREYIKEILVTPVRDLNLETQLALEARISVTRNFRFTLCSLGKVTVSLWVPVCGISAGQSLPVLCTVKNDSRVQFGGIIFVLTKTEIYKSNKPYTAVLNERTDICRIARMADIVQGKYEFYCVLDTKEDTPPTHQSHRCACCQVIYECWVSVQGNIPRYSAYGYPNIDTPGIPITIGTVPLTTWSPKKLTMEIMDHICNPCVPAYMEPLFLQNGNDDEKRQIEDEIEDEIMKNLSRQLEREELVIQKARSNN